MISLFQSHPDGSDHVQCELVILHIQAALEAKISKGPVEYLVRYLHIWSSSGLFRVNLAGCQTSLVEDSQNN